MSDQYVLQIQGNQPIGVHTEVRAWMNDSNSTIPCGRKREKQGQTQHLVEQAKAELKRTQEQKGAEKNVSKGMQTGRGWKRENHF